MLPLNVSVLILCRILANNVLELSKMSKRATWKKILESEEDKKMIAGTFKRIDENTKNFHVRSSSYLNQSRSSCYVFQLKIMLTIERNTRGLRDSLAVRFSGNPIVAQFDFYSSDYNWKAGLALLGLSTTLISKGREHYLAGLVRQGHASPFLIVFTFGHRIHRPIVRVSSC